MNYFEVFICKRFINADTKLLTMEFTIKPIGSIESPFNNRKNTPIQPCYSDKFGTVEIFDDYAAGLQDLEGFSHVILIYYFDRSDDTQLRVKPYLDESSKGIFATRHQNRPNKIGLSIVQIVKIENNKILVKGIDVLNNTPLVDIKPFVPFFDCQDLKNLSVGWLKDKLIPTKDEKTDE